MNHSRFLALAALVLVAWPAACLAIDFKSVANAPAVLYDAPSVKGGKLFIAPRGMPVEVVLSYGEWAKVRDANGDLAWVEGRALSDKRTVVVRTAGARVRASADDGAATVFIADKGLLLELADPQVGTSAKVRHRDGQSGFIKASDIWGI